MSAVRLRVGVEREPPSTDEAVAAAAAMLLLWPVPVAAGEQRGVSTAWRFSGRSDASWATGSTWAGYRF